MKEKPGYKSTEFWLTTVAFIVGAVISAGVFTNSSVLQGLALVSSALAAMGYSAGRSFAKAKIGASEHSARIFAETALKKSPESGSEG